MITIFVKIKNVYGVERIYPDCPVSEIFASLARTKTLSDNDMSNILKLGYRIETKLGNHFVLTSDSLLTIGD